MSESLKEHKSAESAGAQKKKAPTEKAKKFFKSNRPTGKNNKNTKSGKKPNHAPKTQEHVKENNAKPQKKNYAPKGAQKRKNAPRHKQNKPPIKISFLGGLNEVGKNMTLYECGDDMLLVDCGLAFPDPEMFGVDLVIPDFTYVEQNADKLRGILITHGHEDHIGGLAFLLKKVNIPVYSTRLTIGLIEGNRPQEVLAAKAQLNRAQAGLTLAQKTFKRVAGLYKDGLIARQKYDEAKAQYESALQLKTIAAQQYDIAKTGARTQEKSAVQALARQAQSGVAQVSSLESEKSVTSPITGEVSRLFLQRGELAPAGFPIASVVDLSDQWIVFNVREDDLLHFGKDAVLKVKFPALGEGHRTFKVYFVNARGDYATWRSTRQNSGYDLRTFEVRARAAEPVAGLRPGMSAVIER